MKIQNLIENIIKGVPSLGSFTFTELLGSASSRNVDGIAVSEKDDRKIFLAFMGGEPEGAIFIDGKGTLYGDKAVMLITGDEKYDLFEVKSEISEAIVMGCRIMEKSHIRKGTTSLIPELVTNRSGVGVLSLEILQDKIPLNGVRVSIRKEGKIIGSDITTNDGTVAFRAMYDEYNCVVIDQNHQIRTFPIRFDAASSRIVIDL